MSDKRIIGLRNRRSELIRYIHLCEEYKTKVDRSAQKTNKKLYEQKKIDKVRYNSKAYETFKGKPVSYWTDYYDNHIKSYQQNIKEVTKEISSLQKQTTYNKFAAYTFIAVILAITGFFAITNLQPTITGMAVTDITTANVTILNVAPNVTNVTITPPLPSTTSNLSCSGNGTDDNLDEVSLYYKWYIDNILNTTLFNLTNITSGNTSKGQTWICEITPYDGTENGTSVNSSSVTINNTIPVVENVTLNSSALLNRTNESLGCYAQNASDADGDSINYTYLWYKNDTLNLTTYNTNSSNDTLSSDNTTKGDVWICSVIPYDGTDNGTAINSTSLTILNTPPGIPAQITPTNGNNTLFNRNVAFNWSNSTDADGDTITYELNVTTIAVKTNINDSNYTLGDILEVDIEYNWTVRASDGEDYSEWSISWNFTIPSTIIINLTANETDFGDVYNNEIKNTTSGTPPPFEIENIGNVLTDIQIMANSSLWSSVALNTSYFQFMAGNSSEPDSFNWTASQITWKNMTDTSTLIIDSLKYNETINLAEIEFQITVPASEISGTKTTNITVTGVMS